MSNKMDSKDLVKICRERFEDSIHKDSGFIRKQQKLRDQINGALYGDEKKNRSHALSRDMADVIKNHVTSINRTLLSDDNSFSFKPESNDPKHIKEAEEKSIFVDEIIKSQEDYYDLMSGWYETSLGQALSTLKVFVDERTEVIEEKHTGVTKNNMGTINDLYESNKDVTSYDIIDKTEEKFEFTPQEKQFIKNELDAFKANNFEEHEIKETTELEIIEAGKEFLKIGKLKLSEPTFEVTVSVKKITKEIKIIQVPLEDLIAPLSAKSRSDCDIIGDIMYETRGTLKARGYSKKLIDSLPASEKDGTVEDGNRSKTEYLGGSYDDNNTELNNDDDLIELLDLYVKIDYDGDGIIERRHVLISGNKLINEPEIFNHIPYPMLCSDPKPMSLFGSSVAESIQDIQRMQTVNLRSIQDNLALVSNPSFMINENVKMEDLLSNRYGKIIRNKGESIPANNIQQQVVEYTADRTQMLMQFMENRKSATTGNMFSTQGLSKDTLKTETATEFNGMKDNDAAKAELIIMRIAKTGMRQLAETIIYLAKTYLDSEQTFYVNKDNITIDPSKWTCKDICNVSFIDKEKDLIKQQSILNRQLTMQQTAPSTVDAIKLYNSNIAMNKSMGISDNDKFFNNPEIPEQQLLAENEQMKLQLQQMQGLAQNNQLAEAAQIEAQAKLENAQHQKQVDILKLELENKKSEQEYALKLREMEYKDQQLALEIKKVALKQEELEQKVGTDLNSNIQDNM